MRRAIDWEKLTDFFASKETFAKAGVDVETSYSAHLPSEPDFWQDPRKGELGPASQNFIYNEAEAKKLLAAAGHEKGFEFDFYDNKDVGASPTYTPAYYERHQVIMREYQRALGGGIFKPNMVLIPYREWADQILIKWPMKGFVISWGNGGDVDNVVFRLWHSSNAPAFPDAKLDDYIMKQRQIADPVARAGVLKEMGKYLAEFFPSIPTQGMNGTFSFEWPWLHNSYPYPNLDTPSVNGHKQWLDPSTPKRNG
jgi:ABC-type transport system substrate-binding protein